MTVLLEYLDIDTKFELICYDFSAFHTSSCRVYILLCVFLTIEFTNFLHFNAEQVALSLILVDCCSLWEQEKGKAPLWLPL